LLTGQSQGPVRLVNRSASAARPPPRHHAASSSRRLVITPARVGGLLAGIELGLHTRVVASDTGDTSAIVGDRMLLPQIPGLGFPDKRTRNSISCRA
jgi:hypothetical protein